MLVNITEAIIDIHFIYIRMIVPKYISYILVHTYIHTYIRAQKNARPLAVPRDNLAYI